MLLTAVSNASAIRIVLTGALAAYLTSNEKSAAQFSLLKYFFSGLQGAAQWSKCSEFSSPTWYTYCRKGAAQILQKKKKRPFQTELSALSSNCKLVNQTAANRNGITAKICAFLICFLKGQASISFGSREPYLESEILFAKFHQGAITQNEIWIAALSLAAILWPLQGFTLENLAVA